MYEYNSLYCAKLIFYNSNKFGSVSQCRYVKIKKHIFRNQLVNFDFPQVSRTKGELKFIKSLEQWNLYLVTYRVQLIGYDGHSIATECS